MNIFAVTTVLSVQQGFFTILPRYCLSSKDSPLLYGYGLGQIAWLVYIAATGNGGVVGKKLQWQYGKERDKTLVSFRHVDYMVGVLFQLGISLGGNTDNNSITGFYFLDVAEGLFINALLGGQGDNRYTASNQCQSAVL